jgi:hypothetical protein
MIEYIKNLFKPSKLIFIDKDGVEVQYKEHLVKEEMLIIETDTGLSKIPVSGLRIK